MKMTLFGGEKTAMEERLRAATPAAYAPFADAWKEFDKLGERAKHGWSKSLRWVDWIFLGAGTGIVGRLTHRHHLYDAGWMAAIIPVLFVLPMKMLSKRRLAEWKCPRCGALWPGTTTDKEPKCNVCGLRLHQVA